MSKDLLDDNFLNINDNYDDYIEYVRLIFTEYCEIVEKIDKIIEDNIFSNVTYIELTGIIRYAKKRVFPLLSAFLGQDENFDEDIYPEFMDIQLMALYLFDKLQYNLDEIVIKWKLNEAVIDEDIINLETVNYLLKLILPQLLLLAKLFDLKIQLLEESISEDEYKKRFVEVHDDMFI